jgi:hypothetical protein
MDSALGTFAGAPAKYAPGLGAVAMANDRRSAGFMKALLTEISAQRFCEAWLDPVRGKPSLLQARGRPELLANGDNRDGKSTSLATHSAAWGIASLPRLTEMGGRRPRLPFEGTVEGSDRAETAVEGNRQDRQLRTPAERANSKKASGK